MGRDRAKREPGFYLRRARWYNRQGMSGTRFSVVIPTLKEEMAIGHCIDAVRTLDPNVEIIVADGGSSDRTIEIAETRGAIVCQSTSGRGRQMNAGAALASGEVILFLHADTFLPEGTFKYLSTIFNADQMKIGVFRLSFDRKHFLLGLMEKLTAFDLGYMRFGDSCITVRRDFFRALGGFPYQCLFEDLELLRRASRTTRVRHFPMKVTSSARRFIENGVMRQLLRNIYYTARYLLGASPEKLAAAYERGNTRITSHTLLMMVRCPEPGRVKSRLALDLGDAAAAGIYRTCAAKLFIAASDLLDNIDKCLYCADADSREAVNAWAGQNFRFEPQPGGDLGRRLDKGFTAAFKRGAAKVIIAASDVPDISSEILSQGFDALDHSDVVIGPSPDGGYYLIGLKRRAPRLFRDIAWSTGAVMEQTLEATRKSGLTVFLLPPLQDIDTAADWYRWKITQNDESRSSEVEYAPA